MSRASTAPVPPALLVNDLTLTIGGRRLVHSASLRIEPGQSVSVAGPSGGGKTSLLMSILGMLPVAQGLVEVAGHRVTGASARTRRWIRQEHIGVVFQRGELLPELTASENVQLPALLAGRSPAEAEELGRDLLLRVGLADQDRLITTYSGGETRRVAVARALVNSPELVVADEPTESLDEEAAGLVQEILLSLPSTDGVGLLFVTHDVRFAARADVRLRLADGMLESEKLNVSSPR